jgi:hypothetical protein
VVELKGFWYWLADLLEELGVALALAHLQSGTRRWEHNNTGIFAVATRSRRAGTDVCPNHGALDKALLNGVGWPRSYRPRTETTS